MLRRCGPPVDCGLISPTGLPVDASGALGGAVIGRLDEHGKLALVANPATLSPHVLRMLSVYDKGDNPLQKD